MSETTEEIKGLVNSYVRISQIRGTIEAEKAHLLEKDGYISEELELLEDSIIVMEDDCRGTLMKALDESII